MAVPSTWSLPSKVSRLAGQDRAKLIKKHQKHTPCVSYLTPCAYYKPGVGKRQASVVIFIEHDGGLFAAVVRSVEVTM